MPVGTATATQPGSPSRSTRCRARRRATARPAGTTTTAPITCRGWWSARDDGGSRMRAAPGLPAVCTTSGPAMMRQPAGSRDRRHTVTYAEVKLGLPAAIDPAELAGQVDRRTRHTWIRRVTRSAVRSAWLKVRIGNSRSFADWPPRSA